MKKIITYSMLAAITLLGACRKNDNPKLPTIARVPLPLIKVDPTGDQSISAVNPLTFKGKFTVDVFFKTDILPSKFDIVVRKTNGSATPIVKLFMAGVKTFPSTISVSGQDLTTLFGTTIKLGDNFEFGADVYTADGTKYEAFPSVGVAYGGGVTGQPGVSVIAKFSALCLYNSADFVGNYKVIQDGWADYAVGDPIAVTVIDATHLSFKYMADNALPIIITVNPGNNTTSVAKQVYSNTGYPPGWTYGPISVNSAPTPGASDFVAPCDGIVSISLTHTVAAGSFGTYVISFKKQ